MKNKPYTQNDFIHKMNLINPNIEILGEYSNSHSRIQVRCKTCDNIWYPQAYQLIQGSGCPECGKILAVKNRKGKTAKKSTEQFINELSLVNKSITVVGEYTGNKNKINCLCKVCGNKWEANPYCLLNGTGCPSCRKIERQKYRRYTPESYAKELYKKNPNIQLLSDFTKSTEPIIVKCKNCGHIWQPKAYALLQGRGCSKCAHYIGVQNNHGKTGRKNTKTFIENLSGIDSTIEVVGEYINTHTNINCKCSRCNHIWSAKPYSLLQGHGCPRCAKSGTSFMEQLLLLSFREAIGNENVLHRDKSCIGMELDIVVPMFMLAVEPGNWFLHKKSLNKDTKKRQLCREKGFRLITIYDKYPKDIEPPFSEDCYVYNDDLNKIDHSIIHELIYCLLNECGITKQFSDEKWDYLETAAYANSKSLTHDGFVKRLLTIRPDIEVIGKYENSNRRIEVKCRNCGFSWCGIPASLLEGDGCRKCGAKKRGKASMKKQEEFEKELRSYIPSIKVIGEYNGRHKPIRIQCLKCGFIWNPTPGSLLREEYQKNKDNNGCPVCAKSRKGMPKKKVMNIETGEIFESANAAGEKYNIATSAIRQCCRGKTKTSKGFHWKYI